ncbi:MAG: helix-turn-helix transcriptional regulator [Kiritimatiellae bacterium]|nr:helix-turn-helix transcriptional regulator [Kiritimatiellia bacterium]
MRKRAPLRLSFDYMDTPERRVLSLEPDGILCLPVVGYDCYRKRWSQPPFHVHDECLEVTLCLRGDLAFETREQTYPFRPGAMFVSGPRDVHRLRSYPKGMSKYWFLFRIPRRNFPLLSLPPDEAKALVHSLTHLPNRLFAGTDEVRHLFKKLFRQYDSLPPNTVDRSLRLRSTVLALLLAVVDAAMCAPRDRAEVRLKRLVEDMREHPEREYPLDRMAEGLGISPSNLMVRFKRLTGSPPHAFLLSQRIAKAKEMLSSAVPVAVVAHRLGFSSSQHFSNHFKAATGVSPTKWVQGA